MVRALPHGSDSRIDIGRVAAIAAAIAVHAVALLMLLMPMAAPDILPAAKPKPVVRWIERDPPRIIETVPVNVERKEVPKEITQRVVPTRTDVVPPIVDAPAIVDGGTLPAIDGPAADPMESVGPATLSGPLASATLEYVKAPAPRYPVNELRGGIQGTVVLRVLVDTDGTPIEVSVETSSGNKNLDREARQHVLRTWRFKPAMHDGAAVRAYGLVPIAFNLQ